MTSGAAFQEAGRYIQAFTEAMSLHDYGKNELVKAAVERKFAVIGAALVRLRDEYPELLEHISDAEKIIRLLRSIRKNLKFIRDSFRASPSAELLLTA